MKPNTDNLTLGLFRQWTAHMSDDVAIATSSGRILDAIDYLEGSWGGMLEVRQSFDDYDYAEDGDDLLDCLWRDQESLEKQLAALSDADDG